MRSIDKISRKGNAGTDPASSSQADDKGSPHYSTLKSYLIRFPDDIDAIVLRQKLHRRTHGTASGLPSCIPSTFESLPHPSLLNFNPDFATTDAKLLTEIV